MAVFIPEWSRVSGRGAQIKQTLSALDAAHVVRRPLREGTCAADLFVTHPAKGWLAIAVEPVAFALIDPQQLFASEHQLRFEARLVALQQLVEPAHPHRPVVDSLVLMWDCSAEEVRVLSKQYLGQYGTRFVAREQFAKLGARLVSGLLGPVAAEDAERLFARYFPEAEIALPTRARRVFERDNQPRLSRYFLDHEQEWASKLDLDLPPAQSATATDWSVRLVNGVAGSGKTLIAISRARLLAELFPAHRILLLIHNTPIVADIRERLLRAHGELPPNLEIATFFGWVSRQWQSVFEVYPQLPEGPRVLADLVRRHRAQCPDLRQSDAQLIDELDFINESLVVDEAGYLEASRAGRGHALRPRERSQVWSLHQAVTRELALTRTRMWSALPRDLCLAPQAPSRLRKYQHVLVDEAQFFAPSWFQLVKLSLAPQGQLFLCADPNQGFMKSRLSWKRVGIDVAGRTKKLRRSYRTTRALLAAASQVLGAYGRAADEDFLEPDYAGMEEGVKPVLLYTDSPQDAMDRLVNEVAAVADGGMPLRAMLVVYGENVQKIALYRQLQRRVGAGAVWWFNEKTQKKAPPAGHAKDLLRMAYLDTATGLEGSIVFLIGVESLFALEDDLRLGSEAQAAEREARARKLYMAMTRAGQRLVVLMSQRMPPALESLFEKMR